MESLQILLARAHQRYVDETPRLEHSVNLTDDGGAPAMKPAISHYLGLAGRDDRPDDWRRQASKLDRDGRYRTPLRAAIERMPDPKLRLLLRDIVPELFYPSDVLKIHGYTEKWEQNAILRAALTILEGRFRIAPEARRSWVDMSDSQRAAVEDGERRRDVIPLDDDDADRQATAMDRENRPTLTDALLEQDVA